MNMLGAHARVPSEGLLEIMGVHTAHGSNNGERPLHPPQPTWF